MIAALATTMASLTSAFQLPGNAFVRVPAARTMAMRSFQWESVCPIKPMARTFAPARPFSASRLVMKYSTKEVGTFPSEVRELARCVLVSLPCSCSSGTGAWAGS